MKPVNTTYWDVFRIDKLFITEKKGKQVPTGANIPKLELKENGKTPRITVTAINNGIFGYFDYVGEKPSNYRVYKNFISVSFLGTVFYQEGEASLDMKVHCLKPIEYELNKYTGGFLVTAVKASLAKYKYSDQLSSSVLPTLELFLPSKDGSPDWKYMEEYMRKIEQRTQTAISAFLASKNKPRKIDTIYWKEFDLCTIFDIVLSKGDIQAKRMKEGDIPLVSSGKFNNGICTYIAEGDGKAEIFEGNVITTDMFGKSYYQAKPFYAVSHGRVNILIPRFKLSQYIALYLISVLDSSFGSRYSFTGMCSQSQLKQEKILLPSTPAGEPDWRYMEMYMRGVEAIAKEKISLLTKKKQEPLQQTSITNYGTVNIYEK